MCFEKDHFLEVQHATREQGFLEKCIDGVPKLQRAIEQTSSTYSMLHNQDKHVLPVDCLDAAMVS